MKYVILIWFLLTLSACELGRELDVQDMGESAGYFLECYFRPGDLYNLTATRLAPISEPQLLDYSLEFQIHVVGDERIRLYHSFFSHPDKDFVYNYGSQVVATYPKNRILRLEAVAPTGELISGETIVPEQVKIDTAWLEGGVLYYSFHSANDPIQDYYISAATFFSKGERLKRDWEYCDYSNYGEGKITHEMKYDGWENVDEVVIEIKRVSKEHFNYQLALSEIRNANSDNLTMPVMLSGNLTNALGIFTCYTEDVYYLKK